MPVVILELVAINNIWDIWKTFEVNIKYPLDAAWRMSRSHEDRAILPPLIHSPQAKMAAISQTTFKRGVSEEWKVCIFIQILLIIDDNDKKG